MRLDGATAQVESLTIADKQFGPICTDDDVAVVSHKKLVKHIFSESHFCMKFSNWFNLLAFCVML